MAVAARNKAQRDKMLITEDPSLMFSIIKVDVTRPNQGLSSLAPGSGKMRDPGNEVDYIRSVSQLLSMENEPVT